MSDEIVTLILRTVVTAIITYLLAVVQQKRKENSALKEGVQALLRNKIIETYRQYVEHDRWIPSYTKDSIFACYEAYEKLGSNGVINGYMEQIKELPTLPSEK